LIEDFVEFCKSKQEKILHSCKSMPIGDEIEYLRNEMNVRRFLNKWKANNNPRCTTVPINIREPNTFDMATSFQLQCGRCKCLGNNDNRWRNHASMYEPIKRTMDVLATKSELCHYDINLRLCLAMQLIEVGGEHARMWTSFLDLPESHKWPHNFRVLEQFLHPAVEELKHESQVQAVQQEIIMTNVPGSLIDQNLLEAELPRFQVEACSDMGLQVHSSGGKYGSSTGHGLMISALSKKVLNSTVFNKKCAKCTKRKDKACQHNCLKIFEGSLKSMEAAALTQILKRSPKEKGGSICTIVTDDDSNGRAKSRHESNCGILPDHVEEPVFCADPSHRKRVFARPIHNLSSMPKKKSAITKGLAAHIKYGYGACVKQNRHKTAEKLSKKVHNILDHICGIHDHCDTAWCYDKKAMQNNLPYNPPVNHCLDETKYPEMYEQLKEHFNYYPKRCASSRYLQLASGSRRFQMDCRQNEK